MKPINMRRRFKMDMGKYSRISMEVRRMVGRYTSIALFVAIVHPVLRPICRELAHEVS